jgi:hypothetical protein
MSLRKVRCSSSRAVWGREWELYRAGIRLLKDVPPGTKLSAAQRQQVEGVQRGTRTMDLPALRGWLADLQYPLHHFDFETFMTAVPLFDGTRPYQQLPFQYSLHIQRGPGAAPEAHAFLGSRRLVTRAKQLGATSCFRDIGPEGDIRSVQRIVRSERASKSSHATFHSTSNALLALLALA